ncbi:MAG: phosphotransferase [Deltaproteobacteria bacterium]|nr:phosphotransferase [Deltaproteobacteria bacterium]
MEVQSQAWIVATVARLWPDGGLPTIIALKGDASMRRFWRVSLGATRQGPVSAIAIDLGPDDLPLYARALKLVAEPLSEPPWLNVHRFLTRIGAQVPQIYAADIAARMLLVEDVGSMPLFEAAKRSDAGDLYRLAVDKLLIFHTSGTEKLDDHCIAAKIAYDRRLFRWELEQFLEAGLGEIAPGANRNAVAHELDGLAGRLDLFPRVFSHRDYHGHNLFVQDGGRDQPRLRVIDFQDALMAPAAQDLAVLLTTRDAARAITPKIERRILDYYYAALIRRNAQQLPFEEFRESYRLCVLQHALKVIGRFIVLEHQGKSGYREYIPYALQQARRMLLPGEFPNLHTVLAA